MVAGIRDSTQQPQAPAEDEALKRNTDCVYFLASPLTCKKGSECEYRHSEYARVNPRDCWYWLNGNCLNPKCAFRHPPLDGFLGTQAVSSSGSSLPTSQIAPAPAPAPAPPPPPAPATHATYNPSKQAVPCIFFQKGLCLKGDKCAFLHGPNASSYTKSLPQVPAATPVAEPPTLKKPFGGLEKCNQERKLSPANVSKSLLVPSETKQVVKAETSQKNGVPIDKDVPTPTRFNDEVLNYKAMSVPPVTNGNTMSRSNRIPPADVSDDQSFHNGKDADDLYRESSPGFDVLVDDELGDSEYYPDEDQFGRRGREGRNMNSMSEFDIGRSADYNSVADVDREMFRDPRGYDSYEHMQGQYAWEQRRASSERILMGSAPLDRRSYHKSESPDQIDESDLRHHLSKHRRVNGLRSVISHDYALDNQNEERSYRGSRRDLHCLPLHESSLSSRLQGRIKLPGRSSLVNGSDVCSEREMDRGRNFGRLSPGRPQFPSHQGRLRDRIKAKVQEDFNNEERNFSGPRMRRDVIDDRSADFASPKSLAELKVGKSADSKEQQMKGEQSFSLGKRKNLNVEGNQQSEGDLSFEGPKPLSEILKRKKVAETELSGSGTLGNKEGSNQRVTKEVSIGSSKTLPITEMHTMFNSLSEKEANFDVVSIKEESKSATADAVGRVKDGLNPTEKSELGRGKSSRVASISELETEDGMIVDEGIEDHDLEAFDHRDGDFDYEQVEGGDYNLDEGENADPEEEYLDDEDGDDFAKKIGVMFS